MGRVAVEFIELFVTKRVLDDDDRIVGTAVGIDASSVASSIWMAEQIPV